MPIFDIECGVCGNVQETIGEFHKLRCPKCFSPTVKRRWTGHPTIVMAGDPNGSTIGVRKKAQEIMKKTKQ